jgi:4-hydroxyproline epimerase
MATLHARGELAIEERWRQESITGSMFTGWLTEERGELTPHISGRAYVTGAGSLYFDAADPFRGGFSAHS